MNRQIKFQLLYKGMPYSPENQDRPWFKKVYSLDELLATPIDKLSDVHSFSELVAKRQFIGKKDIEGNCIFDGDIFEYDEANECHEVVTWGDDGWITMPAGDNCVYWEKLKVIGNIHQNPELLA